MHALDYSFVIMERQNQELIINKLVGILVSQLPLA
jgi:hypothetical protein